MEWKTQLNIWYVVAAVFGILLLQTWWPESHKVEIIPYSAFVSYSKDGKISEIFAIERHIKGALEKPPPDRRKVSVANSCSRSDWEFEQVTTMSFSQEKLGSGSV